MREVIRGRNSQRESSAGKLSFHPTLVALHRSCQTPTWPLLFACVLSMVLAGCVRFQAKPLSAEETSRQLESRSLTDAGLRAFIETNRPGTTAQWPLATWDFTNLTLAAFYYHPDLDVARAQWATSTAARKTAAERPNPTLSFTPTYDSTTQPWWIFTSTLDVPIETAGKRGYRMAQAKQLSVAARLNLASVAWQVRSRVRKSLVDLSAAQESQRLVKDQQALQSETVKLLEAQLAAGAVSGNEVGQARIAANTSRLALHDAERQELEARAALAAALGIPLSALADIRISFEEIKTAAMALEVSTARRQAVLHRADVLEALAEYAASQSALQLEIAKQYPDIHLNPGYELDQADNKWSLGATVTLPVLNQNQGAIAEAKGKREEAAAKFVSLQTRVLAEVDRAVAGYRAALSKLATVETLKAEVEKRQKSLQAMFAAGEIPKLDLIAARQELAANAVARLDAQAKAQAALGDLEDALQSPAGLSEAWWLKSPRQAAAKEKTAAK